MKVITPTIRSENVLDSDTGQSTSSAPTGSSQSDRICIPNISPRERRKRLAGGVISFILALGVLAILMATGASRWWRLALFPLFAGAASGFFQWRDKT
jgi:fatty acid desaturase